VNFFQSAIPPNQKEDTPKKGGSKKKKRTPTKSPTHLAQVIPPWVGSAEEHGRRLQDISQLDWNSLFLSKGLPSYSTAGEFSNTLSTTAKLLADEWVQYAKSFSSVRKQGVSPPVELLQTIYQHKIDGMKVVYLSIISNFALK
jgi:hypothetical protein